MMKQYALRDWNAEKVARWTSYGLLVVIAVVFVLFFLVGYNRPYAENPNFREPLLTGMVVAFVLLLLFTAIIVAVWSLIKTSRMRDEDASSHNGIPARRIALAVAGGTILLMVLAWLFGSNKTMMVNGNSFTNSFWLKTADMFVCSILVLLTAAIIATLYATWRSRHNTAP